MIMPSRHLVAGLSLALLSACQAKGEHTVALPAENTWAR